MKTLYISDLDGTLLNEDVEISEYTAKMLNSLIDRGLYFSVATARTEATVRQMLSDVKINVPAILMNGVAQYDLKSQKYLCIESINHNGRRVLLENIKKYINSGFLYCIDDGVLSTYYENATTPAAKAFIEERQKKYNKKFTKVTSFSECLTKNIVYYSVDDKKERLDKVYAELSECPDIHVEYYRDIYNTDHWYLEVCSANASKKNAVLALKEQYGFDKVVSFGDNLNDLPMFEASDEAYAVMNAKNEVKEKATGIIGANTQDGVATFLKTLFH